MVKNKRIICILLVILSIIMCNIVINKTNIVKSENGNYCEIVMDVNSKRVIYGNNINVKKFLASTTKILTAITVIENSDINKKVTVTKKSVGVEGSSIYLEEGEVLTVKDLLYGLMLRSGNDCAETLALNCSGSIENFAYLMNKTAKKIGAYNSNFVNPHGLHDDNHYTTAYDLALISCYALKNEIFREIVSTKSVKIPFTTHNSYRYLVNKNKMLFNYDGANGIKTGYTKKAGRCLVSSAKRNNEEYVCVVLDCPPMFERSKILLDYAFNNYSYHKLISKEFIVDFITYGSIKIPICIKNDVILPLSNDEKNNIDIKYVYPLIINYKVKKDEEIGKIQIYVKNSLIFEEKLFTMIET